MIKVIYNSLLKDDSLTATDKILLSFLISKARSSCGFKAKTFWDDKAHWDEDAYWEVVGDNGGLPIPKLTNRVLAQELRITDRGVKKCKNHLIELGYITEGVIRKPERITADGYFQLSEENILKGQLWIFYSWLYFLCDYWKSDEINASADYISEKFHCSKWEVYDMLKSLKSKGLCMRSPSKIGAHKPLKLMGWSELKSVKENKANIHPSYNKLLNHPKWQRKRLEIFQRDNFTCKLCGNTEQTLAVHHLRYIRDAMPWEYPDNLLLTVCCKCHKTLHGK